jgi:chromosome segregation ATPase
LGDISAWVGIGLTALAMTAGCIAYVHALMAGIHARINATREWAEERVKEAKAEVEVAIAGEREERRREYDRLEKILEGFKTVGDAVLTMTEGVKHLGERFDDNRRSTDRALDEIKHGMRQMDAKIQRRFNRCPTY